MSEVLFEGKVEVNGTQQIDVAVPGITSESQISVRVDAPPPMQGVFCISEITEDVGFRVSSTSSEDVGITVYLTVYSNA